MVIFVYKEKGKGSACSLSIPIQGQVEGRYDKGALFMSAFLSSSRQQTIKDIVQGQEEEEIPQYH